MTNLFDNVAEDFSKFRSGYPNRFYEKLQEEYEVGLKNQEILDIATSNGLVAEDLAARGCEVTGIDNSTRLIEQARLNNQGKSIEYMVGDVTSLPFSDGSFDVVTAVHCWKVLPVEKACREAHRVLHTDGKLVIAQFEELSMEGNIVAQTRELVAKHNPNADTQNYFGFYPRWINDTYKAGFQDIETFTFDTTAFYTKEEWIGRMRTDADIGGSLAKEEIDRFEADLQYMMGEYFPENLLKVPSRMFAIIANK